MVRAFSPSFVKFQADIESYLIAQGKRHKTEDGFIVFHGYDEALQVMFDCYLEAGAFEQLVQHFRSWNWEHSLNDYLERLTQTLLERGDWPLLKRLWSAVISKRRKLYNDIRKIERRTPGTISLSSVTASKEKLLEALERVKSYSQAIGSPEETESYEQIVFKIEAGRSA